MASLSSSTGRSQQLDQDAFFTDLVMQDGQASEKCFATVTGLIKECESPFTTSNEIATASLRSPDNAIQIEYPGNTQRHQPLVSSTFQDLIEKRKAVMQSSMFLDGTQARLERFPASDDVSRR